jgi:hypothetical protein
MRENRSSTNVDELKKIVDIQVHIKSARWEIFGTPEYDGGIPGPTDYITLIAEVEIDDQLNWDNTPATGIVWIAPEAPRPWLSAEFNLMLESNLNKSVDLSRLFVCKRIEGRVKINQKLVTGAICKGKLRSLIYMPLMDINETGASASTSS